ncbi:MAG: sigma-70 family RNA polymerase sigma factor [Bacteroidales bacterium]|nr:sigma-70 family RNA polymerase sigma factor [Bacteroidales bacterium]
MQIRLKPKKIDLLTDDELLKQYLSSSNLEYLGELYNRYIHLVYGVCIKYLKDRDVAKDAVNQVFETLVSDIKKYDIANFKSWLYVVAKNYCLMEIRKKSTENKKLTTYYQENFMESTEVVHPIDEDPVTIAEDKLKKCLEALKDKQRISVELFYFKKLCYQEISEEMAEDIKKVKSFIQNGKRNLKNLFGECRSKQCLKRI